MAGWRGVEVVFRLQTGWRSIKVTTYWLPIEPGGVEIRQTRMGPDMRLVVGESLVRIHFC